MLKLVKRIITKTLVHPGSPALLRRSRIWIQEERRYVIVCRNERKAHEKPIHLLRRNNKKDGSLNVKHEYVEVKYDIKLQSTLS